MIDINIHIKKTTVLREAKKTSHYLGKKLSSGEDPGAFERVSLVDANDEQLERFWVEACKDAVLVLSHWQSGTLVGDHSLTDPVNPDKDFTVTLSMTTNWNRSLEGSLSDALMSYLVNSVVARWLMFTDRPDVEGHAALASGAMADVVRIIHERVRPEKRPRRTAGGTVQPDVDDKLWHDELLWVDAELWLE